MDNKDFVDDIATRLSEIRRKKYREDLDLLSMALTALTILTGYWALTGDRLMLPVSVVFLLSSAITWWW
ncbi:hypothetical protein ACFPTO_14605 [Paraburkholderia denitrificans]|uniref:Fatty acid desaturase n=1 Tax=Paraburkholderia denitrificans TaxID=694025 RepID=A0ABW0JAH0_9BURK